MNVRGIVFDLDGTLLNSLADIALAANKVLEMHGLATHRLDAYRHFVGEGVTRLMERAVELDRPDREAMIDRCVADFPACYRQAWNVESRLYDGVVEMLDGLSERRIPMAVLSNKPQEFTSCCVEYYLADYCFVAVLGHSPQLARKPDPAGALQIAQRFGLPPDECLFLGDTAVDMQTARRVGMFAVGALWGFRDAAELNSAGAELLIEQPRELLGIVDEGRGCENA
jgi:phosphoglycolate phosphatase